MKWILLGALAMFLLLGGFLLTPSPIDSQPWQAPPPPALTGVLAPNERLRQAELLAPGQVSGPEDSTVSADAVLYAGTLAGDIVRVFPDGRVQRWVETGGRPLGMVFDHRGNLIVADAVRGLLSVSPGGQVTLLSREAEGTPFRFTDDVAVAPDGTIYFTDASARFGYTDYSLDLLEMRPHGRLLQYSPRTGKARTLLGNLYFANGVVVSPDGDYLLVAETWKYRILRYWLTGPRAGRAEVFADNLPGFPDNLAVDADGHYWVAFPTRRNDSVDALHRSPWLKNLVAKLPERFRPAPEPYGLVMAFDDRGRALISLHDTQGLHLREITSANPHDGYLYFGSLHNDRIGRLPLPAIPELREPAP